MLELVEIGLLENETPLKASGTEIKPPLVVS
jgi:hypothetical protein